jgi:hypothetical protein
MTINTCTKACLGLESLAPAYVDGALARALHGVSTHTKKGAASRFVERGRPGDRSGLYKRRLGRGPNRIDQIVEDCSSLTATLMSSRVTMSAITKYEPPSPTTRPASHHLLVIG